MSDEKTISLKDLLEIPAGVHHLSLLSDINVDLEELEELDLESVITAFLYLNSDFKVLVDYKVWSSYVPALIAYFGATPFSQKLPIYHGKVMITSSYYLDLLEHIIATKTRSNS